MSNITREEIRRTPWKFLSISAYDYAMKELKDATKMWIQYPSKSSKEELFKIWENFHPDLKKAMQKEIRSVMPSKDIYWRFSKNKEVPKDVGGYSLHERPPFDFLDSYLYHYESTGIEPYAIRAYEVSPEDVMIHHKMKKTPLGHGRWKEEKEVILKPGASPRRLSQDDMISYARKITGRSDLSDLSRKELIELGNKHPDLRDDIRKILNQS